MGKIRVRESGNLQFDFVFQGIRCREQTVMPDTPANRKTLEKLLQKIEAEILLGTFVYANYFPNSSMEQKFDAITNRKLAVNSAGRLPTFEEFAQIWLEEMAISWRVSYAKTMDIIVKNRLVPYFGKKEVDSITKADLSQFRASLGKVRRENGEPISAVYINRHIKTMQMIIREAADRYQFTAPDRMKPVKTKKTDVDPMTLPEVNLFLSKVPAEFRNYYIVRFFTGLRTAEIDGLKWRYIDFERGLILVREALLAQQLETGGKTFVFGTKNDTPYSHRNITQRVWYPALDASGLRHRTPYQTRHTAATLWLAAGENPEWIARQMGHTTSEMLFKVYSRYVPNLTRQDGSAFENLLANYLKQGAA